MPSRWIKKIFHNGHKILYIDENGMPKWYMKKPIIFFQKINMKICDRKIKAKYTEHTILYPQMYTKNTHFLIPISYKKYTQINDT
jgi:hypothetical protein